MLFKKILRKLKLYSFIKLIDPKWKNIELKFKSDKDTIVFAGPQTPWSSFHQRPQNIAKELARKGIQVIYCIAPFEKVYPDSSIYGCMEVEKNLIIYSDIESWKLYGNIKYLYCCYPWHLNEAKKVKENNPSCKIVYDIFDDISLFKINKDVKDMHLELIDISDKIFYSADSLNPNIDDKCYFFPNAVDVKHFIDNKKTIKKVCYFGAIDYWFDFDAVTIAIAENTDTIFFFAGVVSSDCKGKFNKLLEYDNAFFLGKVNYNLLPNLFKDCDIGIIPFIKSPLTDAVNPIKLHEYLALGLCVVSTPLNEILKYKDYVVLYSDKNELSLAIKNYKKTNKVYYDLEHQSWEDLAAKNFEIS
ncbi:TPA: glycosyltransferase [Photobacterium damselae]